MVVHPEVGKWLIGLGEKLFGFTPLGWRVVPAIIGTLLILVMIRFVRRLTGSTLLGCVAGLILSFDGLEFVLSRLALLDIFVAFFLLCAVHCLVLDRDWYRARMADHVPDQVRGDGWGPVRALLFRPWLLVSGICWGLACGSKWEAIYPLAAFGILVVAWCAGARRSFGVSFAVPKSLLADGIPAFVHLVLVGLVVYIATWTGWLMHSSQYVEYLSDTQYTHYVSGGSDCGKNITYDNDQALADRRPAGQARASRPGPGSGVAVRTTTATSTSSTPTSSTGAPTPMPRSRAAGCCSTARSASTPRPASSPAPSGCDAPAGQRLPAPGAAARHADRVVGRGAGADRGRCSCGSVRATGGSGSPWSAPPPPGSRGSSTTADRSSASTRSSRCRSWCWRSTLVIGKLLGPSRAPTPRRTVGVVVAGSYVVLVMLNFAWFWPIYTDALLTHAEWLQRIWFSRWI